MWITSKDGNTKIKFTPRQKICGSRRSAFDGMTFMIDNNHCGYNNGYGFGNRNVEPIIYGVTMQKHNAKKVQSGLKYKGKKGDVNISEIICGAYWEVHVYRFTEAQLKMLGKRLVQGTRTFTLEDRR